MSKKILSEELTVLTKNPGNTYGGKVRVYNAKFDLAENTVKSGDLLSVCLKPYGGVVLGVLAVSSVKQMAGFTVNGETYTDGVKTFSSAKYGAIAAGTPASEESAETPVQEVPSLKADSPVWVCKAGSGGQGLFAEDITITPSADLPLSGVLEFKVFVGIV